MKFELDVFGIKVFFKNKTEIKKMNALLKKYFVYKYKDPVTNLHSKINVYNVINNIVYLPKNKFFELYDKGIFEGEYTDKLQDTNIINFNCLVKLNKNQKCVYNYIKNNNKTNYILHAGAGTGKTFLAMKLITYYKRKTLIIVPNTYLLEQWQTLLLENFKDESSEKSENITLFYGKEKNLTGNIVIAIVNSVSKKNIVNDFGLVILDEVHMYNTNSFKVIYTKINFKNMIGLSGTPLLRKNGFDKMAIDYIGEIINVNNIEGYVAADNKFNSTVHLLYYNGKEEYTNTIINEKTGMIDTISMITNIISDPDRNNLIVSQIIKLTNLKHNIFIFSDRRCHLEELYNKILFLQKSTTLDKKLNIQIPELNKSIILFGGSSKDDINTASNTSTIIFTTYQYSSTGVSIDRLDALILATPRRSNMEQIINRIFRLNEKYKHKHRYIIDIIDNATVLKNQLRERKKAYIERGCIFEKSII